LVKHVAQKVLGTLKIEHDQSSLVRSAILDAIHQAELARNEMFQAQFKSESANVVVHMAGAEIEKSRASLDELLKQIGTAPAHEIATKAHVEIQNIIASLKEFPTFLSNLMLADVLLSKCSARKIIDLTNWRRTKYKDLIREKAGADWFEISPEARRQRAHDLGAEITKDYADFEVTGAVFEKLIEPTLIQPTFVTHLPKELVPLAKLSPDDPTTVEVFECCINGQEIAPAYTEQNDPIEQRERLEHQAGGEQQKLDEDFLVALEHGMPPAGGMGMGIDRLCMMLLGQESIRDVILFPQLKPK